MFFCYSQINYVSTLNNRYIWQIEMKLNSRSTSNWNESNRIIDSNCIYANLKLFFFILLTHDPPSHPVSLSIIRFFSKFLIKVNNHETNRYRYFKRRENSEYSINGELENVEWCEEYYYIRNIIGYWPKFIAILIERKMEANHFHRTHSNRFIYLLRKTRWRMIENLL